MSTIKLGTLSVDGCFVKPEYEYVAGQTLDIKNTLPGYEIEWLPVNGILMANNVICYSISIADLNEQGFIMGKVVTINGTKYLCRIPNSPLIADEQFPDEFRNAYATYGGSNSVWNWRTRASLARQPDRQSGKVYTMVGFQSLFYQLSEVTDITSHNSMIGFRPVLVPIETVTFWEALIGKKVTIITPENALHGTLLDVSDYDVFLQLDIHDAEVRELGQWVDSCGAGKIVINKEYILHFCEQGNNPGTQ